MNDNAMPAPPVDIDPRHVFLTAKEVILRYGGPHRRLPDAAEHRLPRGIGDRFRLDTLIAWEQAVLAGPLRGGEAEGPGSSRPALTADPQTSEGPSRIRVPAPR